MKKLAISVVLGSMLFSGNVMSSENYKPREFWDNKEGLKTSLEQAYDIARIRVKGRRFYRADDKLDLLACGIATNIYQTVTNFMEQNCLEPLSMDDFLGSLGLHKPEERRIPIENILDFLNYVGSILGRKFY